MSSKVLKLVESYNRLLDANGVAYSNSNKLPVDATFDTSGLATEATLSAASAKLPSSLGAKVANGSLSVVQASSTTFDVSATDLDVRDLTSATDSVTTVKLWTASKVWDAASTGAGTATSSFNKGGHDSVSLFGQVSGSTTISVEISGDNSTWYSMPDLSIVLTGSNTPFHVHFMTTARYLRLKSSADVTATVWCSVM